MLSENKSAESLNIKMKLLLINPLLPVLIGLFMLLIVNRFQKRLLAFLFVYVYVCSIPFTTKGIDRVWSLEDSYNAASHYDAAIILGGIADCQWYQKRAAEDYVFKNYQRFNGNVDRVLVAAELLVSGRVRTALLGDDLNCRPFNEADLLKDFLLGQGVAINQIEVYGGILNTADEAQKVKEYLLKHTSIKNILLITSEGHMRRAVASFKRQGLAPQYFSVSKRRKSILVKDFIPAAKGFSLFERRLYEIIGYVAYWWQNKI